MNGRERMLAACRCAGVDRPPVWLMRQAGRYLPEYQEIKSGRDFWTLVRSPELAAEVTLQPVRRFAVDAAIVFCDILVIPDAMGLSVSYGSGGPRLSRLVGTMHDVESLAEVDARAQLGYLADTLRLVRDRLEGQALVGFAGAPFTLAAYMVEGRASPELAGIKRLAYNEPAVLETLLGRLVEAVADLLAMQVEAGADVVQVFDTWAGRLSPEDYERWALPCTREVVDRIRGRGVPVVLYVNGAAGKLDLLARTGVDVLSVDARVRLRDARARLGKGVALQGNVDPVRLLGPLDEVRRSVSRAVAQTGGRGHVVNLGHGVLPATPPAAVEVFVDQVGKAV